MDRSKLFDAYEVIGVIAPGVVLALLLMTEVPQLRALLGEGGFGVGDLGLFLMISFVLGHLVQAVGNLVELVVWPISGLPTNRVRFEKQNLVTPSQRNVLMAQLRAMEGNEQPLDGYSRTAWRAVTTRAYARVRNANRSFRVDVANRTYGLFRGLSAAFAMTLSWYAYQHGDHCEAILLLAVALAAAVWRMRRAGIHYARALILEFIDLEKAVQGPAQES